MRTLVYHAGRTDGRAVSEPLELWKCKCSVELSSATQTNGLLLQDWRTALALLSLGGQSQPWGVAHQHLQHSSPRGDGIGSPGTCILFNCCSTSWPTCIVILVRCQFALGVAQASPASSQEKVLVHVTWPCASSLSHSVAPLVCGRSIAAETIKCVGRQTGSVKHSGYSCFVEQHGSLNSAL